MDGKVLVTNPVIEEGLSGLRQHFDVTVAHGLDPRQLRRAIVGVDGLLPLLTVAVDEELLVHADRLRVIANHAVGYDNIDLEAARRRGIWVTNTPGVLTEATADLTWAAMLALVRRVVEGDALVRSGGFTGWEPRMLLGIDLQRKTLGIVGLGQIGRAVARRAVGFGMRVIFTDPSCDAPVELGGVHCEPRDLEQLLGEADVVTLHAPLNADTHHLLDDRRLGMMRAGAYLVNTARGPLVDEAALTRRLRQGRPAGAALDVFEHEPAIAPGLAELPNVLLLPHIGSATRETRLAMTRLAADNIQAVLQGREPPTPVVRPDRPWPGSQ